MRSAKAQTKKVSKTPELKVVKPQAASGELESKYQILFDQASDAILTLEPSGQIDAANQAVEEMTGYHKTELVGSAIDILVPPKSKIPTQHRAKPLSSELFRTPGMYEDVAMARKDGYIRFVDVSVTHVKGKESLAVALFRDLTEKKRMERELITKHTELRDAYVQLEKKNAELQSLQETLVQSGKMAALGELAAGIAHELNQPLQGIRGYAQELQHQSVGRAAAGHQVRGESDLAVKEIISNVDKMANIIGYLRTFTRKSTEGFEETDIHHAIEEALKMLNRQFASRGIQVTREFGGDCPKVYANPLQLEQVFINLATNARDAIEATGRGDGHILIKTRKGGKNGEFAEVLFKDNGCGMDGRTKQKVFNPFFTTKEVGRGMGLGMSISYGILSKLHGSIVVESEIGKGAAFTVRVPKDFRELA